MINKIIINGFQSHKHTELNLSDGINILVGQSNSGKSAIIRALNWVFTNRPLGDGFIKHGEKESLVSIHKPGITVTRLRNQKDNKYIISVNNTTTAFTSFGQEVPPQIVDIIGISDINIQRQFSPYFLVFDSPGSIAEYIRAITDSDEIDRVSNAISSEIRQKTNEINSLESQIVSITNKLDNLKTIDLQSLKTYIEKSEKIINYIHKTNLIISSIIEIVDSIIKIDDSLIYLPENTDSIIQDSLVNIQVFNTEIKNFNSLSNIINSIQEINNLQIKINDSELEHINIDNPINLYKDSINKIFELEKILNEIKLIDEKINSINKSESIEYTNNSKLINNLTICPLCGEVLNDSKRLKLLHSEKYI